LIIFFNFPNGPTVQRLLLLGITGAGHGTSRIALAPHEQREEIESASRLKRQVLS